MDNKRVERVLGLRRSNAAGSHKNSKDKRLANKLRKLIRDSKDEGQN